MGHEAGEEGGGTRDAAMAMIGAAFGGQAEALAAYDDRIGNVVMGKRVGGTGKLVVARWKDGVPLNDATMTRAEVERRFADGDWTPMTSVQRAESVANRHLTPRCLAYHRMRAKSLVATCFRNGPIEGVHADPGPGNPLDDEAMRTIMTTAVDRVFTFLLCGPFFVVEGASGTGKWRTPRLDEAMIRRAEGGFVMVYEGQRAMMEEALGPHRRGTACGTRDVEDDTTGAMPSGSSGRG